ncbi:MAG: PaaI family thioesterase [Deltaproteobacteria bacterium]|nr:MAG: PaaI family thioesterase [Deltaproteobacteria bacterium]
MLADGEDPRRPDDLQFRLEGWIATAPFEDHVGLTIESAAAGEARLSMPFRVCLANGGGVMHGGALVTLADTAVAMAIKSLLPVGTTFATTELTTRFLAPVQAGRVVALARVHGPEGRTFRGEAELHDERGIVVARFQSVFRVARGQGFDDPAGS